MALSAAISVTSNEHLYLSAPLQLHLHLLWPNIWSDSTEEYEKETCGILDHLSTSHLNHKFTTILAVMHLWFCPAHQRSKRALSVFLAPAPLSLFPPPAGCDTAETTERRQGARGANLFQQREAGGDGSDGLRGDVWTCLSHGWSASTCAGLHIWKRSCRREGGVNANKQERQRCYICTSSIQKRRWSLRHTLMRTFGSHWS